MKRIAIVGVGAVGATVAAALQDAGHEIVLCTRQPLRAREVSRPEGDIVLRGVNVVDPRQAPVVDWVLVATKAYDVAGAASWFGRLRERGAPVAVLQNGVEHRERFAPYVPLESIVPVVVNVPVERSPQRVRQRDALRLTVPDGESGRAFVELFAGTSAKVVASPEFARAAWEKLCRNAAGVLPALLLQPAGVFQGEAIGEAARQLVRECVAVARAEGVALDDALVEDVLAASRQLPPDSINSLHADRLAGRPMEIDVRNGVIVRFGHKHGIAAPANQMAVALLEAMTKDRKKP